MSERSVEREGMKMLMKRGDSEVKVSGCTFGMCVCSTGNGRGRGMMINTLDPKVKNTNTEMPPLGLSQEALKEENSICGSDKERDDVDLMPLITFYCSSQVFVCVNGSDSRQCGAQEKPCQCIWCGVRHIEKSVANMIVIDGEGMMGEGCVIGDLSVKSMKKMKAIVHFNETIQEMGNEGAVIVFVNESVMERCLGRMGKAL
ncbi:uncharacterized protein MONOS_13759c2 [Monocercomonoides exilis]|uniref:uncharacterized protein n=1 Tax=Monocercomonoides exilis TaxID=2049356 RepID=UPI00355A5E1F|nr:hypothetical protein MONOS_13759c1 [Monocercomonoides exilis]KAH7828744.1 hypothetical protein MONOS_13759c2 [Monocercomonoides exilis]|eukprot:MONOS_13759.1-p1 / transcript=MONOS_13759.1 / gene=MONOS_13759 / organism=Monocercomonoides_exilis_PA203 / gene_product=unspecified product / transcript_product=unspecified product / location=Mono_scaffold00878:1516-2235(+) / protein_length=202 / sequence_SO=supercontig / SO=protein_coding / is_pseudo=false